MTKPRTTPSRGKPGDVAPEALLRAVIETSDDAILTTGPAGRITTWSPTAERLFGRPASQLLEESITVLFPEHLQDEVRAVVARVAAGERVRHYETEVLRPDGMPMPTSMSMSRVVDAGDQPVALVVVVRDVTEQRLAQATLAEVEGRLEEGEALAHVGSWLWDVRTGAVQWSNEFHRIHGVDPLDFDGTFESHVDVIHPEDRERVRAELEGSASSGRNFTDTYRVVRPDGEVRVVRVRAQPALGSARTVVGLRGTGQDVTERAGGDVNRDRPSG
jgi:PAS domain S-box-containing protein